MRTVVSERRLRFYRLVRDAHYMPSNALVAALHARHLNAVARLAALRVLVGRDHGLSAPSGLAYPQRKKAVRAALGV